MDFNYFIDNYWETFLKHICQFHPLDPYFLKEYEYELDWKTISKNREISWSNEILEKYENRFLWHELAWNESIIWNTDLISKFKKRLDWYYLGRNINLPITSEFIKQHRKKIFIIETNVHLNEALKKEYGKDLLPSVKPKKAPITELTNEQLINLGEALNETELEKSTFKNLYTEFIQPQLTETSLETIFKYKFDYSQKYYRLKPIQNDVHGLTPEFEIDGRNVFGIYREGRGFFEIKDKLKLVNGSLQEGPPRLYELPRFSSMSYYPVLLLSENLKNIIEQFNISQHKFIQVNLSPKKIKTNLDYYLIQIEYDSLLKQANFTNLEFLSLTKNDWFGSYKKEPLAKGEIENYQSIEVLQEKLKADGIKYVDLAPISYIVDTNEDIFTIKGDIIVNEFVKNLIEDNLPNNVLFESVQLMNIKISQHIYDAKESAKSEVVISDSEVQISEECNFFSDKAKRLENSDLKLNIKLIKDEFYQIQNKLNLVIPESFKVRYRNNNIDEEEYEFIDISEFYIQNEYSDSVPETYRSIIVAENGCGDSLGLILDKHDDYRLREELFEFNHETGEVEKYT